jgi:putative hydrolase of the HAD superfamily
MGTLSAIRLSARDDQNKRSKSAGRHNYIAVVSWVLAQPYRAIVIDLDDTILDLSGSERDWITACREAEQLTGEISADVLLKALSDAQHEYWSDPDRHEVGRLDLPAATRGIVADAFARAGFARSSLSDFVADRYRELRDLNLEIFPRAHDTLVALRKHGFPLALLTNGAASPQRAKIERFALSAYFDYIGIEGEAGVGKPKAEAYERALDALGVSADEAVMIGDNFEWEVLAPKRLGMGAVWVNPLDKPVPVGSPVMPDHVVANICELL